MRSAPVALLAAFVAFAGLGPGDASAAFPGRNGKLLYIRENPEVADPAGSGVSGLELWIANADGTGQKRIVDASYEAVGEEAQWSPDGRRIAFSSDCSNKYDLSCADIEIVGASGRGRRKITHAAALDPSGRDDSPTWSPDGRKLAFSRGPSDSPEYGTWVAQLGGGPLTRIANVAFGSLAWSPDGTRIAFVWARAGIGFYVGVMNADGTRARIVARAPGNAPSEPDWSPDGTRIVFAKGNLGASRICVVGAGGEGPAGDGFDSASASSRGAPAAPWTGARTTATGRMSNTEPATSCKACARRRLAESTPTLLREIETGRLDPVALAHRIAALVRPTALAQIAE